MEEENEPAAASAATARNNNDDDDSHKSEKQLKRKKPSNSKAGNEEDEDDDCENEEGSTREQDAETDEGGGGGGDENKDDTDDDDDDVEARTIFVGNLPLGSTRKTLEQLFRGCCYENVAADSSNNSNVESDQDQQNQQCDSKILSARIRCVPTSGVKLPPHLAGNQNLVKKVCANTGRFLDSDLKSSSSCCVGYVVFSHARAVERALRLNNLEVPDNPHFATSSSSSVVTNNHHRTTTKGGLTTTSSSSTRHLRVDRVRSEYDASRSVFVGNLPYHTDEETLRWHVLKTCFFFGSASALSGGRQDNGEGKEENEDPIEAVRVVRDADNHHRCRGFAYVLMKDRAKVPDVLRLLSKSTYLGRELRVQVCGRRFKNQRGERVAANGGGRGGSTSGACDPRRASSNHPNHSLAKKPRHIARDRGGPSMSSAPRRVEVATGALRRILAAEAAKSTAGKKKRARGPSSASREKSPANAGAVSKRSAAQAKNQNRAKKIQKRINKGMGKNKK
jgi:nucleolar protein 12